MINGTETDTLTNQFLGGDMGGTPIGDHAGMRREDPPVGMDGEIWK